MLKCLICFSLPQGHPRCRCLCFHSIFNFDIFRSNHCCYQSSNIMEIYRAHLSIRAVLRAHWAPGYELLQGPPTTLGHQLHEVNVILLYESFYPSMIYFTVMLLLTRFFYHIKMYCD